MYYLINAETETIIALSTTPQDLQCEADTFRFPVYEIKGHQTAGPVSPSQEDTPDPSWA